MRIKSLIANPMLATGNTLNAILNEIKNQGTPKRIVSFNVIASREGIEKVSRHNNDLEIYLKLENTPSMRWG